MNDNSNYKDAVYTMADDLGNNEEKIINNLLMNRDLRLKKYMNIKNKKIIIDCLYGFVVGDAFGVPFEGIRRNFIKDKTIDKMIGFCAHNVPEGTWSDDTSMTLATFDSLAECGDINYEDIMVKFCNWLYYGKYTTNGKVFDVGITTHNALDVYKITDLPAIKCGGMGDKDNGNGSLMRIMPIVLYLSNSKYLNDEKVEIINNVSSLTHANEISKLGCFIYNVFLNSLLSGKDKYQSYLDVCNYDYKKFYSQKSIDVYHNILDGKIDNMNEDDIKSSGYIVNTLESVFWIILNTNNYKDSIIKTIKLGGDTDTIAAIVGSIAGILYGTQNIPKDWIESLKNKEYIDSIINKYDNKILYGDEKQSKDLFNGEVRKK